MPDDVRDAGVTETSRPSVAPEVVDGKRVRRHVRVLPRRLQSGTHLINLIFHRNKLERLPLRVNFHWQSFWRICAEKSDVIYFSWPP